MKLSVILVSHNTQNALRLALNAVYQSIFKSEFEVIVVENASTDRSLDMLQTEFVGARLVINHETQGYSKCYNQAIRAAKGDYLLLLSPEMIVNTDSFQKLTHFMDQHPLAGGASVRSVDFNGDYLPECRNGLPAGWATLLKLIGLAGYFPRSVPKMESQNDWVKEFETSETDTLCSSSMLLRRSAVARIGFFDERFKTFAYPIDLAFRLRNAGFKTYYYSKTYFIQLPGEPLNKYSWAYMSHFYGAMFIFAAKYLFRLPVIGLKDIGEIYPSQYEVE